MDPMTDDRIVHRDFSARSVSAAKRSIEVLASTNSLDSHNTVIDQDWNLSRYLRNPVVLWNHNRFEHGPLSLGGGVRPEDFLPIGRAENVRVESEGLVATIVFAAADSNPLADRILRMYLDRLLRSVSVGFRPGTVTKETIDGREILRLGQNELYEISAVPVGSNPDAVARSATFERAFLAQLASGHSPHQHDGSEAILHSALREAGQVEVEQRAGENASDYVVRCARAAADRGTL
jgi:hypothetical protein